jgi:hypothetical protein
MHPRFRYSTLNKMVPHCLREFITCLQFAASVSASSNGVCVCVCVCVFMDRLCDVVCTELSSRSKFSSTGCNSKFVAVNLLNLLGHTPVTMNRIQHRYFVSLSFETISLSSQQHHGKRVSNKMSSNTAKSTIRKMIKISTMVHGIYCHSITIHSITIRHEVFQEFNGN